MYDIRTVFQTDSENTLEEIESVSPLSATQTSDLFSYF